MSSNAPPAPPSGTTPAVRPARRRRLLRVFAEASLVLTVAVCAVAWWMNSASATGLLLRVNESQVSVVVDAWSGDVDVDDAPGYRVLTPWMQDSYCISKSPIEYVMEGNAWKNHNHVPRIAVRSADGSNFWLEEVRIQYAARPERAADVLRDTGGDSAWHFGTMDAYARAIVRDAFGVYRVEEIVLQENLRDATAAARLRLDEVLEPHGLFVLELSTSKPAFPKEYESVVQRRKVAEQEIQKLSQELEQLRASRPDKLAKLDRQKQRAETEMRSGLAFDLEDARRAALRSRSNADRAYESRLRAGERARDEKLSEANALEETYAKEAQGIRERADALASQGAMAVRKALIESLAKVQFEIAPHDAPPAAIVPRLAKEASAR